MGRGGASIWNTFMSYETLVKRNTLPDTLVFCWTEPYRLYHPSLILSANTEPLEGVDPKVYQALEDYWKYLHNYDKDEMSYEYSIRYYDEHVLSQVKGEVIQMWSFKPFETAGKDPGIKLTTGTFIDESMYAFSGGNDSWGSGTINHMTAEQNRQWADRIYEAVTS